MNKERLEELKKMRLLYEVCFVDEYASAIDDVTADFDLLIKRVQELEKANKDNYWIASDYKFENLKLEQQNKRYREALKFYADEETYETKFATDTDEICDPFTLIELDEGKKARKALEGDK